MLAICPNSGALVVVPDPPSFLELWMKQHLAQLDMECSIQANADYLRQFKRVEPS